MSETQIFKVNVARVGGVCFIVVTLGGLALWCASMPFRLDAAEKKIEVLEHRSAKAEELLSRIDERVKILLERSGGQR